MLTLCIAAIALTQQPSSHEKVFNEAMTITANAFCDPHLNGLDWPALRSELAPRAAAATTDAELSAVINDALSRLHASHTAHYIKDQREYYEVLDVFYPDGVPERRSTLKPGPVTYTGIGLAATVIKGKTFALDVYSGGPADKAGILSGDELIAVEEGPWADIAPFRARDGLETKVTIQRTPDPDSRRTLTVTPRVIHPRELFTESISDGARLIEHNHRTIAYARIRSYAHPDYHERLKDLLRTKFKDADALIIDIRGGWGGASPQYLDIFNPVAPNLTHTRRDGAVTSVDTTWRKPVALLIDHGSRSGKEMFAYAFKKHHIGLLVGEPTAGAVLGGTPRPLSDGSLLFIAVTDVTVDGVRLEGIGVTPDIEVPRNLPYSAGHDPQLDAAVEALSKPSGR